MLHIWWVLVIGATHGAIRGHMNFPSARRVAISAHRCVLLDFLLAHWRPHRRSHDTPSATNDVTMMHTGDAQPDAVLLWSYRRGRAIRLERLPASFIGAYVSWAIAQAPGRRISSRSRHPAGK